MGWPHFRINTHVCLRYATTPRVPWIGKIDLMTPICSDVGLPLSCPSNGRICVLRLIESTSMRGVIVSFGDSTRVASSPLNRCIRCWRSLLVVATIDGFGKPKSLLKSKSSYGRCRKTQFSLGKLWERRNGRGIPVALFANRLKRYNTYSSIVPWQELYGDRLGLLLVLIDVRRITGNTLCGAINSFLGSKSFTQ